MTITDLIIIYLACGSPFSVHFLLTRHRGRFDSLVMRAVVRLFFWPLFGAGLIFRGLQMVPGKANANGTEDGVARLRTEIELAAFSNLRDVSVFEFRDTFNRYSGLALESDLPVQTNPTFEIFTISSHPEPKVASACLARKERLRLLSHLDIARSDFIDVVSRVAGESLHQNKVASYAIETAKLVGDEEGVSRLRSAFGIPENLTGLSTTADGGVELWNAASPSHSTAN